MFWNRLNKHNLKKLYTHTRAHTYIYIYLFVGFITWHGSILELLIKWLILYSLVVFCKTRCPSWLCTFCTCIIAWLRFAVLLLLLLLLFFIYLSHVLCKIALFCIYLFLHCCHSVDSKGRILSYRETCFLTVHLTINKLVSPVSAAQLWVSSVNNNGLSTQPWGDPVFSMMELEVLFPTQTVCQKVPDQETCGFVQAE